MQIRISLRKSVILVGALSVCVVIVSLKRNVVCVRFSKKEIFFYEKEWFRIEMDTMDRKCISCMPLPRCANGYSRCQQCKKEIAQE